jgi:hypothetical protein
MLLWFKKLICRFRGHNFESFDTYDKCNRCGKVHISRAQLLKELLPALNVLFGMEYEKYEKTKLKENADETTT